MPELTRSVVARLRRFFGDRRHSRRLKVRLNFTLSLAGPTVSSNGARRVSSLKGHTLDLSPDGIALIVPTILLGEHHLLGENRNLNVKLDIPDGPVDLQVNPIRYESLEDHKTETGYLIGARILSVAEGDQQKFKQYIASLLEG